VRRHSGTRGFTLIELMVAMSAGLIVAMGAFLMARNASTFFQNEARMTGAQFASMVGMTRLQNDIRRAGMASSPNVKRDPNVCGYSAAWPAGMKELAGIKIVEGGSKNDHSADHALSTTNNLNPDALIIGGMMISTEVYSVAAIQSAGAGSYDIYLEQDGAYWRSNLTAQSSSKALENVFLEKRYLRLVDQEGRAAFGIITGLDESGSKPRITVSGTPALPKRETANVCGCSGLCTGSLVNVVARVKYDLRKVDPVAYPRFAGMFPKANVNGNKPTQFKGDVEPDRTELVRVELDADDVEIASTLEVVAEYAVDLKFGITLTEPGPAPDFIPTVTRYAIGEKKGYEQAASIQGDGRPQYISALAVRLSTRASFADRRVGLKAADGGLFRYNLGNDLGFARMRTLMADVFLANQAGVTW
jgi:prepilin-type N-terminal cleavage/methylation domain-containing protein